MPTNIGYDDYFYYWNWTNLGHIHTNFGYPFSVDGHIYKTKNILDHISTYEFDTPNALEGRFKKESLKLLGNTHTRITY